MIRVTGRKKWLAGLLTLLVGGSVLLVAGRWKSDLEVPVLDGTTVTIIPGVHLIGDVGPSAAYAVETPEGLILIDSGLDADARQLTSELAKLGLDGKQLRAIFLTHVHGDHCGGAEQLRKVTGAKIYAGEADAPFLREGAPPAAYFSTFKMSDHRPHPTTVDVPLSGGETLAFGDVRIRVLDTPGHTPGSTCYLMEHSGLRVFFSGDIIIRLGENPLGTYSTYLAPRYRGDAVSYRATLRKLREMPVPDLVLPGHPRSDEPPQSPQLAPKRWQSILDHGSREMERLLSQYEVDGRSFLDDEPKRLLPNLYYLGDFRDSAVYVFFAASNLFVVDAPGGPGFADFLSMRLKQLDLPAAAPKAVLLTACGERETAGLLELVERFHPQVVASPAGVEHIRKICPLGTTIVPATRLSHQGWFSATTFLLRGRGTAPAAYLISWANKRVFFSGRIPTVVDERSLDERLAEFAESRTNTEAYINSIQQLLNVRPDLWLPAVPTDGQNANVYGYSWKDVLEKNLRAANYALQRR